MSLLARTACCLLLMASALAVAGNAGAQQQPRPSFVVDRWTVEDGLPQNSVKDITQTPDRYLWLATNDGLARFDGVSFTVYNKSNTPAFRSNRVNALLAAPNGVLWIGTDQGLIRYRKGRFQALGDRRVDGSIHSLAGGAPGPLWLVAEKKLVRFRNGRFETLSSQQYPALRSSRIKQPYVDAEGRLWLLYDDSVALLSDGTLTRYTRRDGLPDHELADIGETDEGAVQVGTEQGRLLQFRQGRFETVRRLAPGARAYLFDDQRGLTWTAAQDIRAYRNRRVVFQPDRRKGNAPLVYDLYEDRAGNVWAGTASSGVLRLRRSLFTVYDAEDGLSGDVVLSLSQTSDRSLWIGTNCQGLNRLHEGRITPYTGPNVPADACLYAVLAGRDGGLWVGHHDLVHIAPGGGGSTRYALPRDTTRGVFRGDAVKALYEDPARPGVLWVGTIDGLYRFEDGAVQRWYTTDDGLPANRVGALLRARHDDALWLSTAKGLSRFEDGSFTNFTPETSGFPSRTPRALYEDSTGALWIGTYGDGLVRYDDGQFTTITRADGLFDDVVSAIVPDGQGNLWMSGNRGIFRARHDALDAFADGRIERVPSVGYRRAAGLETPETNGGFQPSAWKDFSGRLWFPTLQGAAVVDPAEVQARAAPPPVYVEEVLHQNDPLALAGPEHEVPQGRRSFAVAYTGVDLGQPEAVRFRYQLDGFDDDWQPAGTRRKAFFTNVPPGDYTFRVQAAHAVGPWSEAATRSLSVPPYFYETTWFAVLCGLLAAAALGGGYFARVWALRRRETLLQQRVDKQTEALAREKQTTERQARKLAELDEAKNRFFANITHEFRTPLTLILGPLKRMRDGDLGALPPRAKHSVPMMLRNSRRLKRLIDQILDLTRLEAGAIELDARRGDLTRFVERVVRRFAPLADRKHLTLTADTPDAPCPARFDASQMDHVLGNLLSNAIKFTPEEGVVRIWLDTDDGDALLAVSDTGIGLSEEAQAHIFDRFFQADDSERRSQEGAGIGLALARELVELHGGAISVDSTPGVGSTFTVRLPLPDEPEERVASSPEKDRDREKPDDLPALPPRSETLFAQTKHAARGHPETRSAEPDSDRTAILVVDDNADVRAYVRSLLTGGDYRVIEATDGDEGLKAAREQLPDLILADVMMPETDGLAMTRALKDDPATACIPVLMLTAKAGAEHAVEGLDAGAEDYVEKPFDADVLRAKVRATLAGRRRLRERFQRETRANGNATDDTAPGSEAPGEPARSDFEKEVRGVVREHLADPDFSVKQLASEMALSRSYFSGKLKEKAGVTPSKLISGMRMERAARLLREEAGSVSEVAYGVGFNSLSYFSQRFKEHHDATPSSFLAKR